MEDFDNIDLILAYDEFEIGLFANVEIEGMYFVLFFYFSLTFKFASDKLTFSVHVL